MIAIKQAFYFKEQNGQDCDTTILFDNLRTPGAAGEDFYRAGQQAMVIFSKGQVNEVTSGGNGAKANFKVLGKSLGKMMKSAAAKIQELSIREIQSILEGATLSIDVDGSPIEITEESIIVQRTEKSGLKVLNEGSLTVALDPEITEELEREGVVRDIVRGVQNLRKESGLEVTDRIRLTLFGNEKVQASIQDFRDYLTEETLAEEFSWGEISDGTSIECGETSCLIALEKV